MSDISIGDDLIDMFVHETSQLLEGLEVLLLEAEQVKKYDSSTINEIFRIMHTIKGSTAVMGYEHLATLSHKIEDMFFFIREHGDENIEFDKLSDMLLECTDFIKIDVDKVKERTFDFSDSSELVSGLAEMLKSVKSNTETLPVEGNGTTSTPIEKDTPNYKNDTNDEGSTEFIIHFNNDCSMPNLKAFTIVNAFENRDMDITYYPSDILENENSSKEIEKNGFKIRLSKDIDPEIAEKIIKNTSDMKGYRKLLANNTDSIKPNPSKTNENKDKNSGQDTSKSKNAKDSNNSMISVSVSKLDSLMDLVGEIVMAQEIVAQNPDLDGLEIENFRKAARQLQKITKELQDSVMSIRMVPLAQTFMKMNRITRDMSKKLNKSVILNIVGEDTEIDKGIIEHISDPLMHLIRNAIDHGIESKEDRTLAGKDITGTVTLEGRNSGSEVLIIVKDDGKGLDKDKILKKAIKNGIVSDSAYAMDDKSIYNLILTPGFSCKEEVTEFSGRGVGMDVVSRNIESVNGVIEIDSELGVGTTITLRIPLTLAIISGMNARVGMSRYTIPTTMIKESFKVDKKDIVTDFNGNNMVMVRGNCYPIIKLCDYYRINSDYTNIEDGIVMMIECGNTHVALFVDELLGGQQVVVKSLPKFTSGLKGISGCTILGDASVSMILDVNSIAKEFKS